MQYRVLLTAITIMPLASLSLPTIAQVVARDQAFSLENNSGQTITRIDLQRSASDPQPLSFRQLVADGELFNLVVLGAECPAVYKLRVQLGNGRSVTSPLVNLCERRVYSLGRSGFGHSNPTPETLTTTASATKQQLSQLPILPAPPPPPKLLPPMFENRAPAQPLKPRVLDRVNNIFSEKGFAPASCSSAPVVMITINDRYTACAYPTAAYPEGQYKMNLPNL